MANPEYVDLLKKDVAEWNRWVAQNKEIGPDLSRANFSGADLSRADLRSADLREARLDYANLCDARLSYANLSGTNVSVAHLSGIDLRSADLSHVHFNFVNLSEALLSGANLDGANLMNANLVNADLREARFSGANLSGADLSGANLSGANLIETVFADTTLKNAKNLEACTHMGPSTIDHRTLEKSGMLPTIFLRGCGLPDSLIEYYPSLLNEPISYYSCFISYSHSEKTFARRLHDQLQGRGIRCWLDEHQILPGDKIHDQVDQGIRYWDKVLLCASQQSLSSWWVENEINKAFEKEQVLRKQRGKKVLSLIPLDLDGYLFDWKDGLADEVKSRHAPNFSGWEANNEIFEQAFESVVKALQTDDAGRESPPIPKL